MCMILWPKIRCTATEFEWAFLQWAKAYISGTLPSNRQEHTPTTQKINKRWKKPDD